MANQSKLKAWVRIDGGGTVVGSGPIFSLKKPKVGKWREMNANLCCNATPSSTTTTSTTNGGGGVTPTAWVGRVTSDLLSACEQGFNVFYTATSVINGNMVYQDAALTNPFTQVGLYISTAGYYYQINQSSLAILVGPCPTTTTTTTTSGLFPINGIYYSSNGGAICSTPIDIFSPFPNAYCTTSTLQDGSYLYSGNGTANPVIGGIYLSNAQGVVFLSSYDFPGMIVAFPCF
jgi:hypothetical protein